MSGPTHRAQGVADALAPGRRRVLRVGAGAIAASVTLALDRGAGAARIDPLRVLCSGPPGSIPDLVARTVADQLFITGSQRAVVDNRPGAAGQISVGALKAAAADGSTLLLAQGAIATVYPSLYTRLGYDPAIDLQPVTLASEMLLGLAVGPGVPQGVASLGEFITWIGNHPAQSTVGSPGVGTLPHLLAAMLFRKAGITWQHVAYPGGPPALTDLLGGRIAALALPEGLLRQYHEAGRVRVLATSGSARSAYMPGIPTFVEQGYGELVVKEWFAFFASARVAPAGIEATSARLREAIDRPELATAFAQAGMTPASSLPSALSARIVDERGYWQTVLRTNDIRAD